jgi:hypothetical protein
MWNKRAATRANNHVREGEDGAIDRPVSRQNTLSWMIRLVLGLAGCVFVFRWLTSLLATTLSFHQQFGWESEFYELSMPMAIMFSVLPFGFNFAFGFYAGLGAGALSLRRATRGEGGLSAFRFHGLLLVWWVIFNLPLFLMGERPAESFLPAWPPADLYPPLAFQLAWYITHGNYGLFGGFLLGILGGTPKNCPR